MLLNCITQHEGSSKVNSGNSPSPHKPSTRETRGKCKLVRTKLSTVLENNLVCPTQINSEDLTKTGASGKSRSLMESSDHINEGIILLEEMVVLVTECSYKRRLHHHA